MKTTRISLHAFTLTILLSLLTGCGGGGQTDSDAPPSAGEGPRSRNDLVVALHAFSRDHNLDELPAVTAVEEKAFQMAIDFQKLQREQPELKELYEKSDALKKTQIDARLAGNEEAYNQALSEFSTVRAEMARVAGTLPVVVEKKKEIDALNEEVLRTLATAAAGVNAEGEKLAKELEALLK